MQLLMIAQPRTGTTLLRNLVNQQSEVFMYGEVLYPDLFTWGFFSHILPSVYGTPSNFLPTRWGERLIGYLDELTRLMSDAGKSVVGFDVKIPQISLVPHFHAAALASRFSILHVRRKNTLAAVLSYETLAKRLAAGYPAHGPMPTEQIRVHLDPAWLSLRIAEFEIQDKWIQHTYRDSHYLELFYEDFAGADPWNSARDKLSAFCGIELRMPFAPTIAKQNHVDLAEIIINHDDIRRLFPRFFETCL